MRIVIVRREPGVALSMDVYADSLIAELKKLRPDWEILEIAPDFWNKNQENLWHSGTGLRKYYERLWRHPRAVRQLQADIFHIIDHSNAHVAYWLKQRRSAIVVTCHDLVQFVYPEILKDQARLPALSMVSWKYSVQGMKQANQVIAVSTNTAHDVAEMLQLPPEKIAVISNGVSPYFQPLQGSEIISLRQRYADPSDFCLLNVGSTHQRKNIPTILKTLVRLREQQIPVKLWKVGDDFTAEQHIFIQAHNLSSMIIMMGKPDKATLLQIYNAADVLLAPSLYEGFGLTVLEAMASGTPVITANVSSLPEVTGDAAILVDPLDVEAIVEAVCQLRQDPAYRTAQSNRGLDRAKQFTWEESAKRTAQIYEKLVKQSVQVI